MNRLGIALIIVGVVLMGVALTMGVGIAEPSFVSTDPLLESGRVANIDLIGQREVLAVVGAAAFIGGWIAVATASLRKALAPPASE